MHPGGSNAPRVNLFLFANFGECLVVSGKAITRPSPTRASLFYLPKKARIVVVASLDLYCTCESWQLFQLIQPELICSRWGFDAFG
jgi:hypothetical protein